MKILERKKDIFMQHVNEYILADMTSNEIGPKNFVLTFCHDKLSVVRCVVRFRMSQQPGIYSSSADVKAVDSDYAVSVAAQIEFERISLKMLKQLYKLPKQE